MTVRSSTWCTFEEGKHSQRSGCGRPSSAPRRLVRLLSPHPKAASSNTPPRRRHRRAESDVRLEARHIKVVATREPSSEACDKRLEKVETDGWYVDLPNYSACTVAPQPLAAAQPPSTEQGACVDRVETQAVGEAKLGFSVVSTVTTTSGESRMLRSFDRGDRSADHDA